MPKDRKLRFSPMKKKMPPHISEYHPAGARDLLQSLVYSRDGPHLSPLNETRTRSSRRRSNDQAQTGSSPTIKDNSTSSDTQQSPRQSEVPSAVAEVTSQIGSPPRRVMRSVALQGETRGPEPRGGPIETGLVAALTSLQSQPNFPEIVSTTNDWGQSLAHLSIVHGYPYLLNCLVDWHINLAIADANGLTALHYAYMKNDLWSIRTLQRGGASESVMDRLGRRPLDLQSEELGAAIDIDIDIDTKVALR